MTTPVVQELKRLSPHATRLVAPATPSGLSGAPASAHPAQAPRPLG